MTQPRRLVGIAAASLLTSTALAQGILRVDAATDVNFFGAEIMPLGDCDSDGVPDYAVEAGDAEYFGVENRSLRVISGATGALIWSNPIVDFTFPSSAQSLGDVNGNGSDDVVYAYHEGATSRVRVVDGGTGALVHELPFLGASATSAIHRVQAIRDLNGDGVLEILVASRRVPPLSDSIFQLFSGATGQRLNAQFSTTTVDAVMVGAPVPGQSRIVSHDGIRVRRHNYPNVETVELDVASPSGRPRNIEPMADVNGDGWDDVLCRSIVTPASGPAFYEISVLSGASLQALWTLPYTDPTTSEVPVPVGDQNADGAADVAIVVDYGGFGLSNFEGWSLQVRSGVDGAPLREIWSYDYLGGGGRFGDALSALPDLDGDGVDELAVTRSFANPLSPVGGLPSSEVVIFRSRESSAAAQGLEYCRNGPANSTGVRGGLSAIGSAETPASTLTLLAQDLPPNVFGIFVVSADPGGNIALAPFDLCLGGSIGRFVGPGQILQADAAGSASLAIDASNVPLGSMVGTPSFGDVYGFQMWHRDVGTNGAPIGRFTSGLTVSFR